MRLGLGEAHFVARWRRGKRRTTLTPSRPLQSAMTERTLMTEMGRKTRSTGDGECPLF
jgi:hypothetical protein